MDLKQKVEELERNQRRMAEEIEQLQRELRALGVQIPELDPGASGRTPLSQKTRLAALRRAAAKARASKPIGRGSGCVKDEATKERLLSGLEGESDVPGEA